MSAGPKDVAAVDAALEAAVCSLGALRAEIPEVHALAYERVVSADGGRSAVPLSERDPLVGNAKARDAWRDLRTETLHLAKTSAALVARVRSLTTAGAAPAALRGTCISAEEMAQALAARQRRQARSTGAGSALVGDYSPQRSSGVLQPGYPHTPAVVAPKAKGGARRGWTR